MASESTHEQLDRMIVGYWVSQSIYAAAKFAIADHLAQSPQSVDTLAAATSTHPGALYRLLRALASVGIFQEVEPRHFALTPLAEHLRSDAPDSKRALALMSGEEQFRAWADITYSIQTGKTAFEKVFGKPVFDYLGEHPEQAAIFDAAMVGIHGRESAAIFEAYDFSHAHVVVDVGGGNGSQISSLLQTHPSLRGVLFDLPHVIDRARGRIESAGLAARCDLVSGSFFEAVPPGGDLYLMRHIIHDWDDDQALAILNNCRKAMSPTSKLLVLESVIPPGNEPFGGKLLDLVMLIIPGGRERTEPEYRTLLGRAGLHLERVIPTQTEVSIVEATPIT